MILAEHGTHIETDRLGRTDAGKRGQIGVHEQDAPLAVGRADHGWNGVDDLRQPFARIAQRFLARALRILELLCEVFGARGELNLLLAQLQEIARASHELLVIDRAVKEVGRAGLERAQPEFTLLVDGDDDDRDLAAVRQSAQAPNKFRTVHRRHFEIGDDQVRRIMFKPGKEFDRIAKAVNGYAGLDRAGEFREDLPVSLSVVKNYNLHHCVPGLLRPRAKNCSTGQRTLRSGSLSDWRDIASTCNKKLPINCARVLVLRGFALAHLEIPVVLSRAALKST